MKTGVVLSNIGSPKTTEIKDVRRYLAEFLMDPRVLDVPFLLRAFIVYCLILPFRPKKSAEAYSKVWTDRGSPLVVYTEDLSIELEKALDMPVSVGMRYQEPSLENSVLSLLKKDPEIKTIILCPMFPHYAMSSTESIVVFTQKYLEKKHPEIRLKILPSFYEEPGYINALYDKSKSYLDKDYDHILFSYHGLPERHLKKTDPSNKTCLVIDDCCHNGCQSVHDTCYKAQTVKTTEALVKKAGIPDGKWSISYQSRLGNDPWITPATDDIIEELAQKGVKNLLVICPAFVTDCLETLEEIAMEAKDSFLENGGNKFTYIPCLNDNKAWTTFLIDKIKELSS